MSKCEKLTVLFFGDVVGKPGVALFAKWIAPLKKKHKADMVIINGENSASNGRGITPKLVTFLQEHGADVITSGNHIWGQRTIYNVIDTNERLLRPLNFPAKCPGKGFVLIPVGKHFVGVVNVQGRIFMHENLACPFQAMESALTYLKTKTNIIIVDFHAEVTSEKQGMGFFLDGKVTAVFGTHTHIQTADEQILPGGTGYITDVGCCGALHSMLGMKKEIIIRRFLTQMPERFVVEQKGPFSLHAVAVTIDVVSGKTTEIERIRIIDKDLVFDDAS